MRCRAASQGLLEIYSQPLIEVNEEDALKLGLNGNKRVRLTSRRGSIEAEAWVTDRVPPGHGVRQLPLPGGLRQ